MRVSEEFTSSLQVAKTSKHKGFSADYYSHSIVADGLLEASYFIQNIPFTLSKGFLLVDHFEYS